MAADEKHEDDDNPRDEDDFDHVGDVERRRRSVVEFFRPLIGGDHGNFSLLPAPAAAVRRAGIRVAPGGWIGEGVQRDSRGPTGKRAGRQAGLKSQCDPDRRAESLYIDPPMKAEELS